MQGGVLLVERSGINVDSCCEERSLENVEYHSKREKMRGWSMETTQTCWLLECLAAEDSPSLPNRSLMWVPPCWVKAYSYWRLAVLEERVRACMHESFYLRLLTLRDCMFAIIFWKAKSNLNLLSESTKLDFFCGSLFSWEVEGGGGTYMWVRKKGGDSSLVEVSMHVYAKRQREEGAAKFRWHEERLE